jgi:hypothetical protein
LYGRLREAGRRVRTRQFLAIEICVLVLMALWTEVVWMLVRGREFGIPRLNLCLPPVIFALHLLATVHWFGVTKAYLSSDSCSQATDDSSDTPIICGKLGPILALINCVVLGVTALLFAYIYEKRGTVIPRKKPESEEKKLRGAKVEEDLPNRI